LKARMRTDPDIATDGSILGLAGQTYCATSFLYDVRGARSSCGREAIEYRDPALKPELSRDPVRPGIRSAYLTVDGLDGVADSLRAAGYRVGDPVDGLVSADKSILVAGHDGVVVELSQTPSGKPRDGALFAGIRLAAIDAQATGDFLCTIGFRELQPPTPTAVAWAQLAPGGPASTTQCQVARYGLAEDGDQFSVVVVAHPDTVATPVPWGGNRQGLYRCALRVDDVRQALAQLPDTVEVRGDAVWCPLPGTKISGLYIAFLRSPDGVVFEFVERPLSHFER